jgi:hypothetical protein
MTTEDTRIVLRTDGADDPVADHPDPPADYRQRFRAEKHIRWPPAYGREPFNYGARLAGSQSNPFFTAAIDAAIS